MKRVLYYPKCGTRAGHFTVNLIPQNNSEYNITCPSGHVFTAKFLHHHFEKLFETSIHSIVNGSYRDAIGAFAACQESFMRLFIEIVISAKGIEESLCLEAWKRIARQSERQLGAYIYLYLIEFNKMPFLIPESQVAIHNKAIHQGYFPSKEECLTYGRYILASIRDTIASLHESESLKAETWDSIFKTGELFPEGGGMTYVDWPLIGANRAPGVDDQTLDEMIEYVAGLGSLPFPSVDP